MNNFKKMLENFPFEQEQEIPFAPAQPVMPDNLAKMAQEEAINQPQRPSRAPASMSDLAVNLKDSYGPDISQSSETRTKTTKSGTAPEAPLSPEDKLQQLMDNLKAEKQKEMDEAASRKFKADIFKIIGDNIGGIVGGAQAMNTGANVTPAKTQGYDVGDLVGQVQKRFDGDREALMAQYKMLQDARDKAADRKYKDEDLKIKREALNKKGEKSAPDSPFEKAQMSALGKNSAEYFTQNRDQLLNNSNKLTSAIEMLEAPKSNISGPGKGLIPGAVRAFTNPEAVTVQESIQSAITDTLRPTLGAQFTENEGKRIMSLQYNPDLPPVENARRAKELQTYINKKVEATDALYEHLGQGKPLNTFDFKKYGMQAQGGTSSPVGGGSSSVDLSKDPRVDNFMKKNNISDRNEAIKILKQAGRI
jgi:hypothetical protein